MKLSSSIRRNGRPQGREEVAQIWGPSRTCKNTEKQMARAQGNYFWFKANIHQLIIFILFFLEAEGSSSLKSMEALAKRDGGNWKGSSSLKKTSRIQGEFAYKEGATTEEKARWTSSKSLNHESEAALEGLKSRERAKNPVYRDISESKKTRVHYRDPHLEHPWNNPTLIGEDPRVLLSNTFKDCREEPITRTTFEKRRVSCTSGIPETRHTCVRYLKQAQLLEKKKEFSYSRVTGDVGHGGYSYANYSKIPEVNNYWFEHPNWFWHRVQHVYSYHRRVVTVTPVGENTFGGWEPISQEEYEKENPPVGEDVWVSDCEELEKRAATGLCYRTKVSCTSEEKTIADPSWGGLTRECFQEEHEYICPVLVADTCKPLREKGCIQAGSTCLEERGGECVAFQVDLECLEKKEEKTGVTRLVCGGAPYCLDGTCGDEKFEPNRDMALVLSKLKVLKEAAHHMEDLQIFKGNKLQCKKDTVGFRDCCGSGAGWGVSMNLAGCGPEEQNLAAQRAKGLCVEVGTYCAHKEKLTKMCLSKKTAFCCFPTKLLKIVQEQGRRQLGLGWGEPSIADCRGLSPEEIQKLDFSKLDLRELEADIARDTVKMEATLKERLSQVSGTLGEATVPSSVDSSLTTSLGGQTPTVASIQARMKGSSSVLPGRSSSISPGLGDTRA